MSWEDREGEDPELELRKINKCSKYRFQKNE